MLLWKGDKSLMWLVLPMRALIKDYGIVKGRSFVS